MILRLKTNVDVESKLVELQTGLQFSTKAAVMRLAIGYSLREKGDPRIISGNLIHYDVKAQDGTDYIRFTIFGNDELIYKVLFEEHISKSLTDDEFFPELTNAHIERGIKLLYSDFKYEKNKDKYFKTLLIKGNK